MTTRHPMDCFLTPPCAAVALGKWLLKRPYFFGPLLDPFAGAGTLLAWAGAECAPEAHRYAFEMDARWEPELRARFDAMSLRVGRDSFAMPWTIGPHAPGVITNPPFGRTPEAVERCRAHAYTQRRWSSVLMRIDWWQHPGRQHLAPDHFLALEWRPVFGLNKHGKFSTDYAGYVWCVWEPHATRTTRMAFLARPEVPREMVAEHRRLARMAHEMGRQMARGT